MMATNRYSFKDMAQVGKWAVKVVEQRLKVAGRQVWDVQDDEFFQGMDVDLAASLRDDVELIEVKGDRYPAKNIYVEWIANLEKQTPGCLRYTQADTLAYYFVNEGVCLFIPVADLQVWMQTYGFLKDRVPVQVTTKRDGKDLYGSIGYKVAINELLEYVPATLVVRDWPKWGAHD